MCFSFFYICEIHLKSFVLLWFKFIPVLVACSTLWVFVLWSTLSGVCVCALVHVCVLFKHIPGGMFKWCKGEAMTALCTSSIKIYREMEKHLEQTV